MNGQVYLILLVTTMTKWCHYERIKQIVQLRKIQPSSREKIRTYCKLEIIVLASIIVSERAELAAGSSKFSVTSSNHLHPALLEAREEVSIGVGPICWS